VVNEVDEESAVEESSDGGWEALRKERTVCEPGCSGAEEGRDETERVRVWREEIADEDDVEAVDWLSASCCLSPMLRLRDFFEREAEDGSDEIDTDEADVRLECLLRGRPIVVVGILSSL